MDYSSSYYTNPEESCKNAEVFGMSKTECYNAMKQQYASDDKDFRTGRCTDKGHRVIKGQYNNTSCSIQFMISPNPKIYGHGYSNNKGFGYNSENSDIEGAKCVDILYQELKKQYPNIGK